ncbi:sulfotransferase family 2 domain-containing protein [Paludibacterium purpuratum]|uniref:Sulfotransferase family protein n=1 Tax=Paludibacterium purpuratum TaxID=1144873 RepID=A0A4R7AZ65_9NEIS|nr:sulfotransferase family 2 domain-containing protein [Paludibacterium purpuratum]TDR73534.1 sulfotransferase family protein [Paludibacterium purpuratum]
MVSPHLGRDISADEAVDTVKNNASLHSLDLNTPIHWLFPQDREKLYFHHMLGTGGTTFVRALASSTPQRNMIHLTQGAPGYRIGDTSMLLNCGPKSICYGHNLFGLLERAAIADRYMTMLRNPYDRLLTDFFWKYAHQPEISTLNALDAMKCFEHFVESSEHLEFYIHHCGAVGYDNKQHFDLKECSRISNPEADVLARRNLRDRFWFVGITELFEESLFVAAIATGVNVINAWWVVRHPKTTFRPAFLDLSKRLRNLIEDKTAYDFALYEDYRLLMARRFKEQGACELFNGYYNQAHPVI